MGIRRERPARAQGRDEADGDGVEEQRLHRGRSLGDISTVIPDLVDNDHNQVNTEPEFQGQEEFRAGRVLRLVLQEQRPVHVVAELGDRSAGAGTVNTISSAPDNIFIQVNASGGYTMSSTTKLVVNGSYARNTQNDSFITNPTTPVVPVSSLNGLVVSTAFNAKLTTRPAKEIGR